jgi:hypothetical protein
MKSSPSGVKMYIFALPQLARMHLCKIFHVTQIEQTSGDEDDSSPRQKHAYHVHDAKEKTTGPRIAKYMDPI